MNSRVVAALAVLVAVVTGCTTATSPSSQPSPSQTATQAPSPSSSGSAATSPPAPTPSPSAPGPIELTVMTYNTLTGKNDCAGCAALRAAGLGDELKLGARMPVVAEKVRLADPDLIGFQENTGASPLPQLHLAGLLPDYTWVNPDATEPIAVRKARFAVVESGQEVLEQKALSCTKRDRTDGRFVSWALLRELASGRELWVFNTHLHPYDLAACADLRAENLARLAALVEVKNPDGKLPQLVLGDFNAYGDETRQRFSSHLTTLAELGMVDTALVAEQDDSDVPGAASAGWMTARVKGQLEPKVVRTTGRHIDYIWVPRGTRVASWAVLSGPGVEYRRLRGVKVPVWTGVLGSDHSPVIARFSLA
ncbi:MAG: endonuclease/exonuclease/phosphatase family protein [Propionicimonas sp.]